MCSLDEVGESALFQDSKLALYIEKPNRSSTNASNPITSQTPILIEATQFVGKANLAAMMNESGLLNVYRKWVVNIYVQDAGTLGLRNANVNYVKNWQLTSGWDTEILA